jgi:hypothetical protein
MYVGIITNLKNLITKLKVDQYEFHTCTQGSCSNAVPNLQWATLFVETGTGKTPYIVPGTDRKKKISSRTNTVR